MGFHSLTQVRGLIPAVAIATAIGAAFLLERQTATFATQTDGAASPTVEQRFGSPQTYTSNAVRKSEAENADTRSTDTPDSEPNFGSNSDVAPPTTNSTTPATSPPLNCQDPQYQWQMNQCAGLDYQRADDALNRVYGELIERVRETRREQLIAAETAWIEYRDATCAFERSLYEGGSIEPLIFYSCMTRETQEQAEYLQQQIDDMF